MSDATRTVPMFLIDPGSTSKEGEFCFDLQPRQSTSRTVRFAITAQDAETLHRSLGDYLKAVK